MFSVFDVETGSIVREVPNAYPGGPSGPARGTLIATSPDGAIVAAVSMAVHRPITPYSTADWSKIAELSNEPENFSEMPEMISFTGDGKLLIGMRIDGILLAYNTSYWRLIHTIQMFPDVSSPISMSISANGKLIAVGSGAVRREIRIFNLDTGVMVAAYEENIRKVTETSWNLDGNVLAFIEDYQTLHLWTPFSSSPQETLQNLNHLGSSISFSPDGRALALASDHTVTVFSIDHH